MLSIRLATLADLPAINDIYNHYVPISTTTYELEPTTLEARRHWFESRDPIHPVTVAVREEPSPPGRGNGDDEVLPSPPGRGQGEGEAETISPSHPLLGFGSLHTFRHKPGYRLTVENSVYVHPDHHRQGVGSAIILDQIERARALGLHAIVAGIDAEQEGSLALHYKHGFREVGRFPQVGQKFDRWLDAVFMELILE
jgi:phosphinothricin acetyltransferase